jgi:hypothetical protein
MSEERHDFTYDLEQAIAGYVELQREVLEQMTGTESIAQGIYDAVDQAISAIKAPVDPKVAVAVERFRNLPGEYLEPALELFTARAFQALLPDMARLESRIEELVALAHEALPSQRAAAALASITRCYLLGLDAETIVMCRAALDVSVSDAVEASVTTGGGTTPASMRKKLELLEASGKLSPAERMLAVDVWARGSEVLHNKPIHVEGAPQVVARTLGVIGVLFPPARRER